MRSNKKFSVGDICFDIVVHLIVIITFLIVLYPFYYSLIISFDLGTDAALGGIYLWPRKFTLENYSVVLMSNNLLSSASVSILRTVIGTVSSVFVTALFSFALSQKELLFRKTYIGLMIFAMYFSGGLIPYFLIIKILGLYNSFWVYIIPTQVSVFNAIIMMSFFREIPTAITESVKIDGANDLVIFLKIICPLSTPVLATIALFNGVAHWNNWMDTTFFTRSRDLWTLSYILKDLINRSDISSIVSSGGSARDSFGAASTITPITIRMATMMVVIIPIACVYPFFQKYFMKGMMLGSVKG